MIQTNNDLLQTSVWLLWLKSCCGKMNWLAFIVFVIFSLCLSNQPKSCVYCCTNEAAKKFNRDKKMNFLFNVELWALVLQKKTWKHQWTHCVHTNGKKEWNQSKLLTCETPTKKMNVIGYFRKQWLCLFINIWKATFFDRAHAYRFNKNYKINQKKKYWISSSNWENISKYLVRTLLQKIKKHIAHLSRSYYEIEILAIDVNDGFIKLKDDNDKNR